LCLTLNGSFQGYICQEPCSSKDDTYPCSENWIGQVLLMLFYGAILCGGAKIISDGSETVLELFPAWGTVIGALLLPVLGAFPDAFIILVSGAFGTVREAKENVGVGVGTLAGSTIMLLTIAWSGAMALGRCDLNEFGEATDGVCRKFSVSGLFHQGVSVDRDTMINARVMLLTSLLYLVVQGPAFFYVDPSNMSTETSAAAQATEKPASLAGFIMCALALVGYCVYQVLVPKLARRRTEAAQLRLQEKLRQMHAATLLTKFPSFALQAANARAAAPRNGGVDPVRVHQEHVARQIALRWRKKMQDDQRAAAGGEGAHLLGSINETGEHEAEDAEEEEHDPRQHMCRNFLKATVMMLFGTALVAIFSDPMVDVITDFGKTINIPPFFVSFIITPFCSNASELISSLIFASKKKIENASLTYSQLYGAATMNNTLCLGLFYAIIYFRGLTWSFTAETLAIVVVTWVVGLPAALKRNFPFWWMFVMILGYPFALVLVYVMQSHQIG
jgi:Ca2+/Na+ antiporter